MRVPHLLHAALYSIKHSEKGNCRTQSVMLDEKAPHAGKIFPTRWPMVQTALADSFGLDIPAILTVPGILSHLITKCMPTNKSCFYSFSTAPCHFMACCSKSVPEHPLQYASIPQDVSTIHRPNYPSSSGCWSDQEKHNLAQVPKADGHRFQLFLMSNNT